MMIVNKITIAIFFCMLFFTVVFPWSGHASTDGLGPFFLQPVNASEAIVSVPEFTHPNYHKKGFLQINLTGRWINVWARNIQKPFKETDEIVPLQVPVGLVFDDCEYETFFFDFEVFTIIPQISFRISERLNVEIKMPFYFYSGGALDEIIESFHDTFGIDQNKRTLWERDKMFMLIVRRDGTYDWKDDTISGGYYGNLVAGVSYRLRDKNPAVGFRVLCRFPTSNQDEIFEQAGNHDITLQVAMSWQKGRLFGYHGAGVTFYDYEESSLMNYYDIRYSFMNTLEYSLSKNNSFIFQSLIATPLADYSAFDEPVFELAAGFKRKTGIGVFEFGIMENVINYDNSPDIGIHFGYTVNMF